jgi:hypothetical protein
VYGTTGRCPSARKNSPAKEPAQTSSSSCPLHLPWATTPAVAAAHASHSRLSFSSLQCDPDFDRLLAVGVPTSWYTVLACATRHDRVLFITDSSALRVSGVDRQAHAVKTHHTHTAGVQTQHASMGTRDKGTFMSVSAQTL